MSSQLPASRLSLPRSVHVIGACGQAIGGVAMELRRAGVEVTASDRSSYHGMRERLEETGIDCRIGFDVANFPRRDPDLVLAGSLIARDNLELVEARRRGVPVHTFAEYLAEHWLGSSRNWVVAGTNGKSTTTALLVELLQAAGHEPGYLLGARFYHEAPNVRLAEAAEFVLEGDEYQVGLGNLSPKFALYRPRVALLTNIDHDHNDIYPTRAVYRRAFAALLDRLHPDGLLVVNGDDAGVAALLEGAKPPFRILRVGFRAGNDCRLTGFRQNARSASVCLDGRRYRLGLAGRMNALNAALALSAVAGELGSLPAAAGDCLAAFSGVRGRLHEHRADGILCHYDDEGYHPHSVGAVLATLRDRYSQRRLASFFQPRGTAGLEGELEQALVDSLARADRVFLTWALRPKKLDGQPGFDSRAMIEALRARGVEASYCRDPATMSAAARRHLRRGDVVHTALAKVTLEAEAELFATLATLDPISS